MFKLRSTLLGLTLLGLATITFGCDKKVKAGDACTETGKMQCIDDKTAGVCIDGKYEPLPCEAATGCMNGVDTASCSHRDYKVGEPCPEEGDAQCTEDESMIKCENNHWKELNKCKGKLGCRTTGDGATCDLGASAPGDDCTPENEGNASCTEDGSALLLCREGKMVLEATCKGMHGCRQLGESLECNSQIADLDDPCDRQEYDGGFACTPDKKMRLVCTNGTFIKEQDCNCNVMIDDVTCK